MKPVTPNSKKALLKIIDDLEKRPHDKVRILGDAGITVFGAGLGATAAATIASAAGATSVFGLSTAASWVGLTVATATPIGWTIAATIATGAAAYGVSRLIRSGSWAEGRKVELLARYRAELDTVTAKEEAGNVSDQDRTSFVVSLRALIEHDVIEAAMAFRMIEQVERGTMALSDAIRYVAALLVEANPSTGTAANQPEEAKSPASEPAAPPSTPAGEAAHKVFADKVENVSMGLGITSGIVAAGASVAAPTGLSAIGVALGVTSAPLIVTAAPVIATVATAAGVVSGTAYFYSKWKSRAKKNNPVAP